MRRLILFVLMLGAAIVATRADDSPMGKTTWQPLGLSGGGAMFCPAISPVDGKLMMVNCDMSAAYLSKDGGVNWRMLRYDQVQGNTNCKPAFDPVDAQVIYAASGWDGNEIHVTHDQGDHWKSTGDLPGAAWGEIAIDPGNRSNLLVGLEDGAARSNDSGATWTHCDGPHGKALGFHFDLTSPKDRRTCFAATTEGIWRSDDGGTTWKETTSGLPSKDLLAFAGGSNAKDGTVILYGSVKASAGDDGHYTGGIYLSSDRGTTWKPAGRDGLNTETKAFDEWAEDQVAQYVQLLTTNANPKIVYAFNTSTGVPPPHNPTVYRSDDAGQTWRATFQRDPRYKPFNVEEDYVDSVMRQAYASAPSGVAINAANPDEALAISDDNGFITQDGGKTWVCLHTHPAPGTKISNGITDPDATWICDGLVVTTTWNFYIDPFEPDRRYICYTDLGFARSLDRGKSWKWWAKDGRPPWENTCYELAFDPQQKGKIWGAFSDVHDIPNDNIISGRHGSTAPGGVCVSTDFAATWQKSNAGLPAKPVTSVVVDPKSPPGARVLYAGIFGGGVYKSTDDGKSWKEANNGLGAKSNLRVDRVYLHPDGTLFAQVTARRENGVYQQDGVGLYRSTDGAATWTQVNASQPLLWPKDFTVDPKDSKVIYVSAADAREQKQGGLYRTTDGGSTWKRIGREGPEHFGAYLSPFHPGWIYMTLTEGAPGAGLWLSRDNGTTWTPMSGLPFSNVQRVAFDPTEPDAIYVTTFGGSVWHGPASE